MTAASGSGSTLANSKRPLMANKEDDRYYYDHGIINHFNQDLFLLAKDGLYVITGADICQARF